MSINDCRRLIKHPRISEIGTGALILGLALVPLFFPESTNACGSMGRNISRGQVFTAVGAILFLPMLLLIPLEIAILRKIGGLGDRVWAAYGWCLLAKVLGVAAAAGAVLVLEMDNAWGIVVLEGFYSAIHFLVSYGILSTVFKKDVQNALDTAGLISTVIPWLYSLGIPATAFLVVVINS